MAIPNKESARYSSFQEFMSFSREKDNHPSYTNLYSVSFSTPPMLRVDSSNRGKFAMETGDLALLLDYYAESINLPSRQITTGTTNYVGAPFKYATNTSYSQMNISFRMPRSQYSRNLFERWTQLMSNDADQYTKYYQDYVCPEVRVYKWERGGGDYVYTDPKLIRALREAGDNFLLARKYQLTACWKMQNVYPYNIGSIQLDNQQAKVMTLNVGFYYERYRFYTEDKFDEGRVFDEITIPATTDNFTDETTSRNTEQFTTQIQSNLGVGANDLSGTSSGFA